MATPDRDRRRDQRREAQRRRNALRAGAQARVADHLGVDAAAARSRAHLRLTRKIGWANHNEIVFPRGTDRSLRSTSAAPTAADVAVAQLTTDRDSTGERDHVTVAARLINTGATPKTGRRRRWRSADATCRRSSVTVPARGALQVAFTSIAVPSGADEGRGPHHARFADAERRAELHDRARRGGAGAHRRADDSARRTRACS